MKNRKIKTKWILLENWFFREPYYGVPWLVWFYAVLCCALYPHGGAFAGLLNGYDDPVRMTQVLNWVNGAGFYDRLITRVDPPDGFRTIWARIVDVPIAVVILVMQAFVVQKTAALIASIVIPFIELAILFWAARYYVRPIAGQKEARLVVLFMMFTTVLNYKFFTISGFHPGEASHHPWYIILNLLLYGAAARLALGVPGKLPARMMTISIALMLAVGIEGFPLIGGAIIILCFIAWYWNRPSLALKVVEALFFAAVLSALLLPLHQPPAKLFTISFAEPSLLGPILIGSAAIFVTLEFLLLRFMGRDKIITFLLLLFSALLSGLILVRLFPTILEGPAAALSPAERLMAFREHSEVQPLYKVAVTGGDYLGLIMPTVLALLAGLYAISHATSSRRKAMHFAYFSLTAVTGGLAETLSRFYHHALTTACAGLLYAWQEIRKHLRKNQSYNLLSLSIFIMLGPFWMLLVPALVRDSPVVSQVLLYPAKLQTAPDPCNVVQFGKYLSAHYSKDTLLISPGADSSRLLYYSDLKIDFLNNYPSQDRFIDNQVFFGTQDLEIAKAIALRHRIDLVAFCQIATIKLNPLSPGEEPMLFERLENNQPPSWLIPINTGIGGYKLYEVDKAALGD